MKQEQSLEYYIDILLYSEDNDLDNLYLMNKKLKKVIIILTSLNPNVIIFKS